MTEEQIKKNLGRGKDLRGQKYERLTPLYPLEKRIKKFVVWHCKCDCGNEVNVIGSHLQSGHTRSCGCLNKEQAIELGKSKFIDLSGQEFGQLKVLQRIGKYQSYSSKSNDIIYLCQCKCGRLTQVLRTNLVSGTTKSCGCIGNSYGEVIIKNILEKNNIPFKTQKTFETCRFPDTNALAKFDFYVNNQYLIEFDGEQHYSYKDKGWFTKEVFQKIQMRDNYKNQWCKDNNIPLIRIPYTYINNLCIEDLKLETSQFIIN